MITRIVNEEFSITFTKTQEALSSTDFPIGGTLMVNSYFYRILGCHIKFTSNQAPERIVVVVRLA